MYGNGASTSTWSGGEKDHRDHNNEGRQRAISIVDEFFQGLQRGMAFRRKSKPQLEKKSRPNSESDTMRFEHIELSQFSRIEIVPGETGIGHDFSPTHLYNPTWCDLCGEFIWGFYKHCHKCQNCSYTCHERCVDLVTLDCKVQTTDLNSELVELKCERCEAVSWTLKGPELRLRVEQYNVTAPGYEMEMQEDGETFHGFIRVHMNLSRPINVVAGTRPPSMYNIIYEDDDDIVKTLTSFYLPRDTVKALHITSDTTAREVIGALLKKFKVIDNPLKFCLYEKSWDGEGSCKVTMRRLYDREKPLWLPLKWAADDVHNRQLVLQENDTGDIAWDEFSLPELNNFLKILDREEEEYLNQVRLKYRLLTAKLDEAMQYSQQNAADK